MSTLQARYGTKGQQDVQSKPFDSERDAIAFAQRWVRGNQRTRWAAVYDLTRGGIAIKRLNLM